MLRKSEVQRRHCENGQRCLVCSVSIKNLTLSILLSFVSLDSLNAVTYYFQGSLSDSLGNYTTGTTFSGSFSYDYPQASSGNPDESHYIGNNISFTVGNESLLYANDKNYSNNISIYNKGEITGGGGSFYGVLSDEFQYWQDDDLFRTSGGSFSEAGGDGGYVGGKYIRGFILFLRDSRGLAFPNTNLVGDTMRLTDFDSAYLEIGYQDYPFQLSGTLGKVAVRGSLTSIVPEPTALSLLAIGLGGLAYVRRRRS